MLIIAMMIVTAVAGETGRTSKQLDISFSFPHRISSPTAFNAAARQDLCMIREEKEQTRKWQEITNVLHFKWETVSFSRSETQDKRRNLQDASRRNQWQQQAHSRWSIPYRGWAQAGETTAYPSLGPFAESATCGNRWRLSHPMIWPTISCDGANQSPWAVRLGQG